MLTVKEIMNRNVYSIRKDATIRELLNLFVDKNVTGVPVVDDKGLLVGMISDADILGQIHEPPSLIDFMTHVFVLDAELIFTGEIYNLLDKPVHTIMTRKLYTVTEDTSLTQVARTLSKHKFKKMPVLDGGKLIGVVNRGNVLSYLVKEFLQKEKT